MKLFNSIKSMFNSSKEEDKSIYNDLLKEANKPISVDIFDISPNIYLACRASKICIGKTVTGTLDERMNYISKVVGRGHESVIEHTNIISLMSFSESRIVNSDWLELLANMKFLNTVIRNHDGKIYVLIGGSIRGYLHVLRETNVDNTVLPYFKNIIYSSIEKVFLKSVISEGLLEEDKCTYYPNSTVDLVPSSMTQFKNEKEKKELKNLVKDNYDAVANYIKDPIEIQGDYCDLVFNNDPFDIFMNVKEFGFSMRDVYKVTSITFVFHDISRSCANQLVRHRNAITQESQRYVTKRYKTEEDFVNPIKMQLEDRYKDTSKTVINKALNFDVFENYRYLISGAVFKEDARAFLPMNVKTTLMMTFTYWNFAKFLDLRLDKAAQLEIRRMAKCAAGLVFDCSDNIEIDDFIKTVNENGYKDHQTIPILPEDIDEVLEEKEEIKPMKINPENAGELIKKNEELKKIKEDEI